MNTAHIKNLAIAYEALSRCVDAGELHYAISKLLSDEIDKANKENRPQTYTPPRTQAQLKSDEIPF